MFITIIYRYICIHLENGNSLSNVSSSVSELESLLHRRLQAWRLVLGSALGTQAIIRRESSGRGGLEAGSWGRQDRQRVPGPHASEVVHGRRGGRTRQRPGRRGQGGEGQAERNTRSGRRQGHGGAPVGRGGGRRAPRGLEEGEHGGVGQRVVAAGDVHARALSLLLVLL